MELSTINFQELEEYVGKPNVRIIDLRSRRAYQKSHIKDAENIPYFELQQGGQFFNRENTIIFYCDRGNSSLMACREFTKRGYDVKAVLGIFLTYKGKYLES